MIKYMISMAVLSVLIYGTSCTKDSGPVIKRPPGDTLRSFKNDIQPIFDNSCALGGCHAGALPAAGMNLENGQSYNNIVGVAAVTCCSPAFRIKPFDADTSELWNKVNYTSGWEPTMPLGGSKLSQVDIDNIKKWIEQGAKNN